MSVKTSLVSANSRYFEITDKPVKTKPSTVIPLMYILIVHNILSTYTC